MAETEGLRDIKAAAAWLGIPSKTLQNYVTARSVPFTRVGRHVRFSQAHLDAMAMSVKHTTYHHLKQRQDEKAGYRNPFVDMIDLIAGRERESAGAQATDLGTAQERGWTRLIGVSNFPIALLKKAEAILGKGRLATNQVEVHPFLQNRTLREWFTELPERVGAAV